MEGTPTSFMGHFLEMIHITAHVSLVRTQMGNVFLGIKYLQKTGLVLLGKKVRTNTEWIPTNYKPLPWGRGVSCSVLTQYAPVPVHQAWTEQGTEVGAECTAQAAPTLGPHPALRWLCALCPAESTV